MFAKRYFLLFVLFAVTACSDKPGPVNINLGDPAPAFALATLDGKTADFPAAYAGKPVVIRFWADWCRFCEGEMKGIEPVYQRYQAQGVEILAVNAGQERKNVADFMARLGVSYPALVDENADVARRYGVVGLPTTFFVDGRGVVRAKIVGEADAARFEQTLREVLP